MRTAPRMSLLREGTVLSCIFSCLNPLDTSGQWIEADLHPGCWDLTQELVPKESWQKAVQIGGSNYWWKSRQQADGRDPWALFSAQDILEHLSSRLEVSRNGFLGWEWDGCEQEQQAMMEKMTHLEDCLGAGAGLVHQPEVLGSTLGTVIVPTPNVPCNPILVRAGCLSREDSSTASTADG